MQYDYSVFIGRFQPFHNGHKFIVDQALQVSKKVIILVGSSNRPLSSRDPWTFSQRAYMIEKSFSPIDAKRLVILPINDYLYNDDAWILQIQNTVYKVASKKDKICLVGHKKDNTSYYVNLFPLWDSIAVMNYEGINATDIRKDLFEGNVDQIESKVSKYIYDCLKYYMSNSNTMLHIVSEYNFVQEYKKKWSASPYPPTFVTVDAVVTQSGYVLMVERGAHPGKGLLALPGGFVNQDETMEDACIRELKEETKLKVPVPVLKGSIKSVRVFDDPNRSQRGRTITQAYHIELQPNKDLPKVKGSDDAKRAFWVSLANLDPTQIFEDHYFIIANFLGI